MPCSAEPSPYRPDSAEPAPERPDSSEPAPERPCSTEEQLSVVYPAEDIKEFLRITKWQKNVVTEEYFPACKQFVHILMMSHRVFGVFYVGVVFIICLFYLNYFLMNKWCKSIGEYKDKSIRD